MDKFREIVKKILNEIRKIFVPDSLETDKGTIVTPPKPVLPYIILALLLMIIISSWATDFSLYVLVTRLFNFKRGPIGMIKRFFPVDWSYYQYAVDPIIETIQMSFLGSLIGSIMAFPVAFLASQNLTKSKTIVTITRVILSIFRTMPILIYAVFLKYIFYPGAIPGIIAIALFTFSIVSKMLYERIEVLDLSAYHAIQSTGASKIKAVRVALMPFIAPIFYSISLYAFEINIRYAAILGYVGAGGIGVPLDNAMKDLAHNDRVVVLILFIFVAVVAIENLSRYLRKRLG